VPWLYGLCARRSLKRKVQRSKSIVFTFDDGLPPGAKLTSSVLDVLAEHGAKATFFLLGKHIPGREATVRRIAGDGHEIGSHGYEHLNYWKVSPLRTLKDIKQSWRVIDETLGFDKKAYLFRPPYGKLNLIGLLYLWMRRVHIVYWTLDLGDTWSAEKRDAGRIQALLKDSKGEVVLAHDFDRVDESLNKMVLESVRFALAQAKEKKMPVLTVSQLLSGAGK
jgi:peptidoglycan/xylan/chitin deacetylase (PgdA/CDA1 family)